MVDRYPSQADSRPPSLGPPRPDSPRSATCRGAMSVVTAAARRRWAIVVAGTAFLVAAPSLASAAVSLATRPASVPAGATLLRRVLASASVAHQGLAES